MPNKYVQLILVLISAVIITFLLPGMSGPERLLFPAIVPFLAVAPAVAMALVLFRRCENRLRSALILTPLIRRKSNFRDF